MMKEIIEVPRPIGSPSQIIVGDVLKNLSDYLPDRRVIIITDSNIHRRYKDIVDQYENIIIGLGETNKTLITVEKIYNKLLELNADRECFILGFGGGIVTDVTGFAASTYMRGLPFGFIASTLLSQVDASVGGKNGVNLEGYKNMIGTFNQPDFVLCDTSVLETLPERELKAGMAEMIKSGIISDPDLFSLFENNFYDDFKKNQQLLINAITATVKVKGGIVERDERESGERRKLNLGHTFAHAIEKNSSSFLHGEAVSIGLVMVSDLSVKMGIIDPGTAERIKNVLKNIGLPLESGIDIKRLLKSLRLDKKRDTDSINLVLPEKIGSCVIRKMKFEELEEYFS